MMSPSGLRAVEYHVNCRVGRLIEGRLIWLNDAADVAVFQRVMAEAFARAGTDAVICADWRRALVFSPQASEAMIELLRRGNRQLSRSAVLLSGADATFGLQVERLFREANNPNRRSFRAPAPMLTWLAEVLSPAERARAAAFIAEGG
jgi:hypothetical protein